jgi:hypothetical protein
MLPRRSNWNLSPSMAFASDGTAYAPFITSFDCGLRSPSQSSSSAGFWIGKTSRQVSGTFHYNRHLQQEGKEENTIPLKETVSQTIWLQPWVAQPQEKAPQPSVIRPTQIVDESEIKSCKKILCTEGFQWLMYLQFCSLRRVILSSDFNNAIRIVSIDNLRTFYRECMSIHSISNTSGD